MRFNLVKNTNFEWGNNQIFLTQWKIVFWVTDHFCIKWTLKKNAIFCPKNAFFGQTCQFDPLCRPVPACSQGHNFRGVYFYLIPEGFIGGRWRRWWNPPLIIFNLARNGPFLEDLKKKFPKVTRIIYTKCMLPKYIIIHGFWPHFCWTCPNLC